MEIEAVVNPYPHVYVDDDINFSMILTPSNFLSFHSQHTFPNILDDPDPEFEVAKKATSSQELLLTWKRGQNRLTNFGDYGGMISLKSKRKITGGI